MSHGGVGPHSNVVLSSGFFSPLPPSRVPAQLLQRVTRVAGRPVRARDSRRHHRPRPRHGVIKRPMRWTAIPRTWWGPNPDRCCTSLLRTKTASPTPAPCPPGSTRARRNRARRSRRPRLTGGADWNTTPAGSLRRSTRGDEGSSGTPRGDAVARRSGRRYARALSSAQQQAGRRHAAGPAALGDVRRAQPPRGRGVAVGVLEALAALARARRRAVRPRGRQAAASGHATSKEPGCARRCRHIGGQRNGNMTMLGDEPAAVDATSPAAVRRNRRKKRTRAGPRRSRPPITRRALVSTARSTAAHPHHEGTEQRRTAAA